MWDDVNHGKQSNERQKEDGNGTLLQWGANVLKNVFGGSEEEKNATYNEQVNDSHPFHTESNKEEYKEIPTFSRDVRSDFYRTDSLDKDTPDFSNLLREMYNEPSGGGGLKTGSKTVPKRKSIKRKAVASIKKSKKSSSKSRTLPKSRKLSTKRMSKSSYGASARKKSKK